MIPYIIEVSIITTGCWLFYKIFLRKETFFSLNRWVLLFCIAFSFILPFLPVPAKWSLRNKIENSYQTNDPITLYKNVDIPKESITPTINATIDNSPGLSHSTKTLSWINWLTYLYIAGIAIFGLNLLFQILILFIRIYSHPFVQDGPFRIVEVTGDKAPCSFGNTIFINPSRYDYETYEQILMHEKVHCNQKHTIDILLSELVLVFQWFNPFAWFYRKQVESNLEFIADDSMIHKKGIVPNEYQLNLLKVAVPHLPLGVTTNYNQSLIKKRIAMMNNKKSSFRTIWKYFFLFPLLTALVCTLNEPVINAQSNNSVTGKEKSYAAEAEGTWFAKIKKDLILFEFKPADGSHNWSNSNISFRKSELPVLPTQEKADFKLTRDAGTVYFNGKFDDSIGYGHFKFTPDQSFISFLKNQEMGIDDPSDHDMFAFFGVNLSKAYINSLVKNGYKNVSKNNLIAMAALEVDESYIRFWKSLGYNPPSPNNLISAKALGIDSAYVDDLQKAGYTHLDINKLVSFKAQGITGEYVKKIKAVRNDDENKSDPVSADDVINLKALNIDNAYIKSLKEVGYEDISYNSIISMKSLGVDASFIKSFQEIGYKDITPNEIITAKSLGINPGLIKEFKNIGFDDISIQEITSAKALGVSPDYVASMKKKGFESKNINTYIQLKARFKDVQ